ncbi:MAG: PTS glucose/sucrose transporter subunit IIB [Promicromonosporaceae bacterium]|nr:PTS glucose/sucrose transporter subunit IIB [Promicromonosporaceae bacterium]
MTKAVQILSALGGAANISELDPCITRLRLKVVDPEVIDEPALQDAGALGVVRSGRVIQVIIGPEADDLCAEMALLLAAD